MTPYGRIGALAAALFAIGAVVLLLANPDVLRLAGSLLMLAAVFLGVAALATPELLGRDEDEDRHH